MGNIASSIEAIKNISKNNSFPFEKVSYEEVLKEIQNLDASKACQDTDVPTKKVTLIFWGLHISKF